MRLHRATKLFRIQSELNLFKTLLISIIFFFGSFYVFDLNSLYATLLGTLVPTAIIWFNRHDLIINSVMSGIILFTIATIVYSLLELATPGWVQEFWKFENILPITLFNVPVDDLLWYVASGMFIGPLYEFWKEGRLY